MAYDYQPYAYETPPALRGEAEGRHKVAIVGAGPIGLAVAIDLAMRGVPSVLLDDNNVVSQPVQSPMKSGNGYFTLGWKAYGENFPMGMDGRIGPVAVWKRLLSSEERALLWNSGAGLPYEQFQLRPQD